MKLKLNILAGCALLFAAATTHAELKVVATLPDFGAIAEVIGGEHVKVTTLAKGTEDPHFVDAKPSFLTTLNKADLLLEGGAELELGWLPALVNNARNRKILPKGQGDVALAREIQLLEIPSGPVDRSMGDVHPGGNPHFWLDPNNGKIIAREIVEAFTREDAKNAAAYQANLKKFTEELDRKITEWKERLAPYRGTKVVTYHKSFDYFLHAFGFELAGTVEPKPGIEPSPGFVNSLIPKLKEEGVKLLIIEPYRPRKTPEYIADAVGARLLILPEKVGGNAKAKDYISLFEYNVTQIANALSQAR